MKLADRAWVERLLEELASTFASRTADEWETALLATPAAAAKWQHPREWLAHEQLHANELLTDVDDRDRGRIRLVGPPIRLQPDPDGRTSRRRHGSEGGALAGVRVIDLSSYWAGPLAARLLAELGADVVKVEPPGGEGSYQLVPCCRTSTSTATVEARADARSERGRGSCAPPRTRPRRGRRRRERGARHVGTARAGGGDLRAVNPSLVYARAKGFGSPGRSCRVRRSTTSCRPPPEWR